MIIKMILTYMENEKLLSNDEIKQILKNKSLNITSRGILFVELKSRTKW